MTATSSDVKRMVDRADDLGDEHRTGETPRIGEPTRRRMQAIDAHKRVQPSTLSAELGLHQSSVTRQIQSLERAGHVKVTANPADGRSCFVELTPRGRCASSAGSRNSGSSDSRCSWPTGMRTRSARWLDCSRNLRSRRRKLAAEPQPMGRTWQKLAVRSEHEPGVECTLEVKLVSRIAE